MRFLSVEPLLGPVDLLSPAAIACRNQPGRCWCGCHITQIDGAPQPRKYGLGIDWVIVGGESGPGARSCDVAWIRSIVEQCRAAGTPAFLKQLGARPYDHIDNFRYWPDQAATLDDSLGRDHQGMHWLHLRDSKGGDPEEWPEDLRVREIPVRRGA